MTMSLNAAIRRRSGHSERGATTLEVVGMYVVAAILAAAVTLAAVGSGPVIGDRLSQALCMVTTFGQGSCESSVTSAADHKPTEPCVVSANGHTGAVEGSVVVTVGGSEHFLVEKLDNGQSRVTRGSGNKVGIGVGEGFNVTATWDDKTYGAAAKAEAGVAATFTTGEVYYADDEAGVASILSAHKEAVAKAAVSSSAVGSLLVGAVNMAEDAFDVGNHFPPPDETYIEGGVTADLKLQGTSVSGSAQAAVGGKGVLGTRQGKDGTSTTYLKATLDGNISAGTWTNSPKTGEPAYAKAGQEVKREGIFEVERDAKGIITAVRVKSAESGNQEVTAAEVPDTVDGPPGEHEYSTETVSELPIRSVTDQAVAQRYLNAAGLGPMAGFSDLPKTAKEYLPIPKPADAREASSEFGKATGDRGLVTKQTFVDNGSSKKGLTFDASHIAKASGAVTYEETARRSTGLEYYDGSKMVTKKGCGEK
ncbi:MAG TPA: hypothetical protein VES02_17515 [Dermatophilaceae bacterium]|nr:hypothetical protein [Dermatophilaceae bacterium]